MVYYNCSKERNRKELMIMTYVDSLTGEVISYADMKHRIERAVETYEDYLWQNRDKVNVTIFYSISEECINLLGEAMKLHPTEFDTANLIEALRENNSDFIKGWINNSK
jgi:hypothetical protein